MFWEDFYIVTIFLKIMVKGLLLLSSGIDSPVAGHLMKKKGVEVIAIHFDNGTDKAGIEKVKKLKEKINLKKLFIFPYKDIQIEISKTDSKYQCVFCKRFMFKFAEKLAKKEKCDFLITGNNLGQVASQTLENMYVTKEAVKIKILDPLLTNDKQETINLAKELGTYEISIQKCQGCPFVPNQPVTKAKLEKIKKEEEKLNIDLSLDKIISC